MSAAAQEIPQEWWLRSKDPIKFALAIDMCGGGDIDSTMHGTCVENGVCRRGDCFGPFQGEFEIVIVKGSAANKRATVGHGRSGPKPVLVEAYDQATEEGEIAVRLLTGFSGCLHKVQSDDIESAKARAIKAHERCIQEEIDGRERTKYLAELEKRSNMGPFSSDRCIVCGAKLRSRRSKMAHVSKRCAAKYDLPY